MEKIIDTAALIDAVKIVLWDRSKTREEMAELVIGLIEETGEGVVRCPECENDGDCIWQTFFLMTGVRDGYCYCGNRRDSDG